MNGPGWRLLATFGPIGSVPSPGVGMPYNLMLRGGESHFHRKIFWDPNIIKLLRFFLVHLDITRTVPVSTPSEWLNDCRVQSQKA